MGVSGALSQKPCSHFFAHILFSGQPHWLVQNLQGATPCQVVLQANWQKNTGQCDVSEVYMTTMAQKQLATTQGQPGPTRVLSGSSCSVLVAGPGGDSECHHPHFMDANPRLSAPQHVLSWLSVCDNAGLSEATCVSLCAVLPAGKAGHGSQNASGWSGGFYCTLGRAWSVFLCVQVQCSFRPQRQQVTCELCARTI